MSQSLTIALAQRADDEVVARIETIAPGATVLRLPGLSSRADLAETERADLMRQMADVDVLVGWAGMDRRYVDAAQKLRWWQLSHAGADALAPGLLGGRFVVTNARGMSGTAMAEWVLGAVTLFEKGFHQSLRDQAAHRWSFRFVGEARGKTLGIVGMGSIGRDIAKLGRAYGMRVLASRRSVTGEAEDPDCDELLGPSGLSRILAESDYVVLVVPLIEETQGLIGEAELKQMKPTARLINVARGPVVDTAALLAALQAGTIAGAALDVTDPEPLPADHPLWDQPEVIITPHLSGAMEGYMERVAEVFLENLARFQEGLPLLNVVEPGRGY